MHESCEKKYCYVDPCNCDEDAVISNYWPDITLQGRPLLFSYATCGDEDLYTKSGTHEKACVNQENEGDCNKNKERCTWKDDKCRAKELVDSKYCPKSSDEKSGAGRIQATTSVGASKMTVSVTASLDGCK